MHLQLAKLFLCKGRCPLCNSRQGPPPPPDPSEVALWIAKVLKIFSMLWALNFILVQAHFILYIRIWALPGKNKSHSVGEHQAYVGRYRSSACQETLYTNLLQSTPNDTPFSNFQRIISNFSRAPRAFRKFLQFSASKNGNFFLLTLNPIQASPGLHHTLEDRNVFEFHTQ